MGRDEGLQPLATFGSGQTNAIGQAHWLGDGSGFLIFTAFPVVAALALSFFRWDLLSPPVFVGAAEFPRPEVTRDDQVMLAAGAPFQGNWLDALLSSALPRGTEHVLLFAFRGNGNDGVVSLVSQLEPRAQAAATGMRGYDETHTSILRSPVVAREVTGVLDRSPRRH